MTSPQRTCDVDVGGRGLAAALWPAPFDLQLYARGASDVCWRRSCHSVVPCPALTSSSATCGADDAENAVPSRNNQTAIENIKCAPETGRH